MHSNGDKVHEMVGRYFTATLIDEDNYTYTYLIICEVSGKNYIKERFSQLYNDLVGDGYYPLLYRKGEDLLLKVTKHPQRIRSNKKLFLILFSVTIASVFYTGYLSVMGYNMALDKLGLQPIAAYINPWVGATGFTIAVVLPIFLHELGHYFASRKTTVPASYPLPIPAPVISPLGTFGAIILMRYFPKKLVDLAKVSISGPLFGVVLSLAIYVVSYLTSPTIPPNIVMKGVTEGVLSPLTISPLSAYLISTYLGGGLNSVRLMTPIAEAAYLILLIHFANLLPIGQLDGGHIARALTSSKIHFIISLATSILAVAASLIFHELMWLAIFIVLAWILSGSRPHIGAANMLDSMSPRDKLLYGITYVILLIATFPIPIT